MALSKRQAAAVTLELVASSQTNVREQSRKVYQFLNVKSSSSLKCLRGFFVFANLLLISYNCLRAIDNTMGSHDSTVYPLDMCILAYFSQTVDSGLMSCYPSSKRMKGS